jgi:hypothetical protein
VSGLHFLFLGELYNYTNGSQVMAMVGLCLFELGSFPGQEYVVESSLTSPGSSNEHSSAWPKWWGETARALQCAVLLCCDGQDVWCTKCIFNLEYFQVAMDLLGCGPTVNREASGPHLLIPSSAEGHLDWLLWVALLQSSIWVSKLSLWFQLFWGKA